MLDVRLHFLCLLHTIEQQTYKLRPDRFTYLIFQVSKFVRVKFAISQRTRLGVVLMEMRECEVALRVVETDDEQCDRAHHVFLERELLQLSLRVNTYSKTNKMRQVSCYFRTFSC